MQPELSRPLLIEFDKASHPLADWQETGSDFCLYYLREAFGSICVLPQAGEEKSRVVEYTDSVAFRALAGLVAFTLWLPITFIGIILNYCSKSHETAYLLYQNSVAEKQVSSTPTPAATPPTPKQDTATVVHTTAATVIAQPITEVTPATLSKVVTTVTSQTSPVMPPSAVITAPPPPPTPPPPPPISTRTVTIVATPSPKSAKAQLEESIQAYASHLDKTEQLEAMSKLCEVLSTKDLEYFMTELNMWVYQYSPEVRKVILRAAIAKDQEQPDNRDTALHKLLVKLFSMMSDEEYVLFLPVLDKVGWFPSIMNDRIRVIGKLVMRKIKPRCEDLWETWNRLWKNYELSIFVRPNSETSKLQWQEQRLCEGNRTTEKQKEIEAIDREKRKIFEKADNDIKLMLQDALQIIGDDAYLLAKLYGTVASQYLLPLLSTQQLVLVIQGLNEISAESKLSESEKNTKLLGLTSGICSNGLQGPYKERLARVAIVPVTLGKHPMTWLKEVSKKGGYSWIQSYFLLHEVQRVLTNAENLERSQQVQAIATAFRAWLEYANDTETGLDSLISEGLGELSVLEQDDYLSIILDGYALAYRDARQSQLPDRTQQRSTHFLLKLARKRVRTLRAEQAAHPSAAIKAKINKFFAIHGHFRSKYDAQIEMKPLKEHWLRNGAILVMQAVINQSLTTQKLHVAFSHFLSHVHSFVKLEGRDKAFNSFVEVLTRINTENVFDALIDAILTAGFSANFVKNRLLKYSKQCQTQQFFIPWDPLQIEARFEERRKEIEDAVKVALQPTSLPPELQGIVLDYVIAVDRGQRT